MTGEGAGKSLGHALLINTTLRVLHLGYNELQDDGVASLLANGLRHNRTLETLSLQTNDITMVGMQMLAQAMRSNVDLTLHSLNVADSSENGFELKPLWLHALEGNGYILDLIFDINPLSDVAFRVRLHSLLARNRDGHKRARQAVLSLLILHRLRRPQFILASLLPPTILRLAQLIWRSRGDEEWWP